MSSARTGGWQTLSGPGWVVEGHCFGGRSSVKMGASPEPEGASGEAPAGGSRRSH